jgi:uncharacterized membrane protein
MITIGIVLLLMGVALGKAFHLMISGGLALFIGLVSGL